MKPGVILHAISDRANRFRLRARVRRPFAILTNNCWGSALYRDLDIPYNTPFVGTLVPPECYLRLLADVRGHLDQPLRFIETSRYGWPIRYPLALLGDSEIHFKHYRDRAEAAEKWTRRLDRMPRDPAAWRVKFCDHHLSLDPVEAGAMLHAFDRTPFEHKLCLLGRREPALACGVVLRECLPAGRVPDGHAAYRPSLRYFNASAWLNG
ncbi:MAG: DUF1919 domain-containing protein [Terrimicrobiaceae bacterium]|nr:DUF1919 domain-containing protein [Terrimicrobiaceae bacterium]